MVSLPELLAPAGNMEALRAAVANGADAVYLGGKDFSARQYAANFTSEELAEAVAFAHVRGVKVYVTVNTLIAPEELGRALDYVYRLHELGVDAVLVQDLGLAWALRQALPALPLHASTQMTVHNVEGVRFLARFGFKRVVLARELELQDLAAIRSACPEVEPEVFVHGALCFSYSGQCLLSSFVGGRSGNRGRCAQPCRLRYRLEEGRDGASLAEGHLLSTKDLNLIALLPELVGLGVAALKIEGRMKRAEYVATVTRIYRQALDRYACDPEHYQVSPEELRDLAQIFNRDFTTGYLRGNPGRDLMSYQRPNNRGLYLGRVIARQRGRVAVSLAAPLRLGDGLEFWVSRGGRQGQSVRAIWVNGAQVEEAAPGATVWLEALPGVAPGDRVFKTYDRRLAEAALASYAGPQGGRRVPLYLNVTGEPGRPLKIVGRDDRGHAAEVATAVPCQEAKTQPLTPEVLAAQLGRLGGTPFYLAALTADLKGETMVPWSCLNEARRRLVAALVETRLRKARPYPAVSRREFERRVGAFFAVPTVPDVPVAAPKITVAVGSPAAARAALAAGADRVYVALTAWQHWPSISRREWREALREADARQKEFFPALPRFWHPREKDYLEAVIALVDELNPAGLLIAGPEGWELARARWPRLQLVADHTFHVFNPLTRDFLRQTLGFTGLTLSPELRREQLAAFGPLALAGAEIIVHGNFPLMVSAHCVIGACAGEHAQERRPCRRGFYVLVDRRGYRFPLACDRRCRLYLFNSRELSLLTALPDLLALKPWGLRLELRRASEEEVALVVTAYRRALDLCLTSKVTAGELAASEAELARRLGHIFTRGHYYRGVS